MGRQEYSNLPLAVWQSQEMEAEAAEDALEAWAGVPW